MKLLIYFFYICLSIKALAQERLVDVNGINFNVYPKGLESRKANAPVLIFENGMGVGLGSWDTVLDELSKAAPVIAYDRANVEKSGQDYKLPTIKRVAENLKAIPQYFKNSTSVCSSWAFHGRTLCKRICRLLPTFFKVTALISLSAFL